MCHYDEEGELESSICKTADGQDVQFRHADIWLDYPSYIQRVVVQCPHIHFVCRVQVFDPHDALVRPAYRLLLVRRYFDAETPRPRRLILDRSRHQQHMPEPQRCPGPRYPIAERGWAERVREGQGEGGGHVCAAAVVEAVGVEGEFDDA